MQLGARIDRKGNMYLSAYTFSDKEFRALEIVLEEAGIFPKFSPIRLKFDSRPGRRYFVPKESILRFASVLGVDFDRRGQLVLKGGLGGGYACEEIKVGGRGNGCEEFSAQNDNFAIVICGMIAKGKKWFGGVPRKGGCYADRF
jgi:hypothetical protein